jgi:hypothetical protein
LQAVDAQGVTGDIWHVWHWRVDQVLPNIRVIAHGMSQIKSMKNN